MSAFEQATRTIQFLSVDAVEKANSGHPGAPMGLAGVATEIWSAQLRHNPEDPTWANRDRFVLSCGHASMLLYSVLHLAGYDVEKSDLESFRQWGAKTPGHPEHGHTPGVETTTGPLGQGIATAVGMALASKLQGARLNQPGSTLIDYRVFVLASDGDLMEGICYEATSLAGHLGLDNLVVVYDDNRITIDGETSLTFTEDTQARFEAAGWFAQKVDGHDPAAVHAALDAAVAEPARPSIVIARTHIAKGAPTKQDTSGSHGAPLGAEEVRGAKEAAGWPTSPFHVAELAREPFRARVEAVRPEYTAWTTRVAALEPARARLLTQLTTAEVPDTLLADLVGALAPKKDATRSVGGKVEQEVAARVPALVGGSADLAGSVKTTIVGGGDVARGEFAGRNLHYGIREHAMGAISNGLALSGLLPFASTFLIFSDYMRPAMRLAAMMQQRVVYVLTHDSIFLGEDGPTHQPIEQLASLRLIPNLDVWRPADALETAAAWAAAASRSDGPSVLALTRQNVPVIERADGFDPRAILRGAYVVAESAGGAAPTLVLIATGSEMEPTLAARALLEEKGHAVRVVSAPCWDAFERLSREEREQVLPPGVRRVSVEAGRTTAWRGVVGLDGITVGIDRFGASAPAERLAEEFGLTGERVAAQIIAQL